MFKPARALRAVVAGSDKQRPVDEDVKEATADDEPLEGFVLFVSEDDDDEDGFLASAT